MFFFGEGIPANVYSNSFGDAEKAKVCIIIGSTGEVVPASYVPQTVKGNGATIIEINPEESNFTNRLTDIYLQGKAGEVLTDLKRFLFKILVIAYDWNYNFKYSNNKGLF